MAVFWLEANNFSIVIKRFLELIREKVALGSLVNVTWLVVGQLNRFCERGQRFFEHFKVGVGNTQMIVDVCFVCLKRMIVQRCVKVLYCFLELFILVEGKTAFVENFGVSWFSCESIAEVIDGLGVLLNIDVNVAPLHQKILVSWLTLQSLV